MFRLEPLSCKCGMFFLSSFNPVCTRFGCDVCVESTYNFPDRQLLSVCVIFNKENNMICALDGLQSDNKKITHLVAQS